MKSFTKVITKAIALIVCAFLATMVSAAAAEPTPSQQAQIDELKKSYVIDFCFVSGDNLEHNNMNSKIIDYLYKQKNPDGTETTRLLRFCCKDCLMEFKRNPGKFLKILDKAEARKKSGTTAPDSTTK